MRDDQIPRALAFAGSALKSRATDICEQMESESCNSDLLNRTFEQFRTINRIVSGWSTIYRKKLRPVILANGGTASILDIGCGAGDVLEHLGRLCLKDGFEVTLTGIDIDPRAVVHASSCSANGTATYRCAATRDLVSEQRQYDIVLSNHLLHHLNQKQMIELCVDSVALTSRLVLFSDLERSQVAYTAFSVFAPLIFRRSYIVPDGLTSIHRSFRGGELRDLLPEGWRVSRAPLFRLIATYERQP